MKSFDLHCHFNHGSKYDTNTDNFYNANLDFLKKERDKNDIVGCAVCSFASVLTNKIIVEENDYLYNLVSKEDWLFQWAVLNPEIPETFKQVESLLKDEKVLGIKIHSILHNYRFSDYSDEIFSFAKSLNAWVLMHPDNITETSAAADKYNVKLINAHLGGAEHVNAIANSNNNCIFTDTSGMASSKNNVIEFAVQNIGSEKIFFGTDTYSCAFQKGRIVFADITERDKENILFNNAVTNFPSIKKYLKV